MYGRVQGLGVEGGKWEEEVFLVSLCTSREKKTNWEKKSKCEKAAPTFSVSNFWSATTA